VLFDDTLSTKSLEGRCIGPYQLSARIGRGGMGEVYRGRDTKLNRQVAIKVLLPEVANDADRLARFRREAQLLASLNHPHIAQIRLRECGLHISQPSWSKTRRSPIGSRGDSIDEGWRRQSPTR
jgi:serine/threonine protein kinase